MGSRLIVPVEEDRFSIEKVVDEKNFKMPVNAGTARLSKR